MVDPLPVLSIELGRADAIVLFDWAMTVDYDSIPAMEKVLRA